ncbi:MAG: phosphotransferase [Nitrospinae bacterium]|nr:phosphotransferase [Nitrospinota bacterium]
MKASLTEQTRAHERLKTLARAHFGGVVSSLTPIAGDASTRDYARLTHADGACPSSIGMIMPEPFSKETLPFIDVQTHFKKIGVKVPEIYAVDEDAGVILLEDCGDESLEDAWRGGGWEEAGPHYDAAMDMMAAIQEAPSAPAGGRIALTRRFDPEFFTNELHHTRKYAFESLLGMDTDERALDAAFRKLCEEICRIPFRLTHRDYHSRNLMVLDEAVIAIDFQDARMGPATYDLASLAFDSYVDLGDSAREYLTARYWETCGHRLFSDKEEYERALRATAIQRNLKAIGTFAYQKAVRGAERYLASIPHTVRMVRAHFEKRRYFGPLQASLEHFLDALLK